MISTANMLPVCALVAAIATNATSAVIIDTRPTGNEFDFIDIFLQLPIATAAGTSTVTSLVFRESDSTSSFTTTVSTGGTDFTIPTSNDTVNPAVGRFQRSQRGKKRYIQIVSQAAAGYGTIGYFAMLSQGHVTPSSPSIITL